MCNDKNGITTASEYPKRKNIRLEGYNYSQGGYYFITICTENKRHIFGEIITDEMILNADGENLQAELQKLQDEGQVKIPCRVIMPNHVHFILWLEAGKSLGNIIRRFKGRVTRAIGKSGIWQRNYYEHIIRGEQEYWQIVEYIVNNPANWEADKEYSKYL